jgi:hypothetical protein
MGDVVAQFVKATEDAAVPGSNPAIAPRSPELISGWKASLPEQKTIIKILKL